MDLLRVLGFELVEPVGSGLAGEVFRVRRIATGETVALKLSHSSPRHSASGVAFKLEYYLHTHLNHPDIVRAYQFGEIEEERRFYTMEYVPSVGLARVFREGGIRALGEAACRVAEALEYAHAQGILHGDVKPANILVSLDESGEVAVTRLADFGLSQRIASPVSGSVRGTLAYLAPETLMGWRVDGRADLYSLGVSLYEAVIGRPPLQGAGAPEAARRALESRLVPVRELAPDLETGWASLIDELVARSPADRPVSASAAASRMRSLLGKGHGALRPKKPRAAYLAPSLALVGRDAEMRRLLALVAGDAARRPILVVGEEGVGKTRLLDEFAERAALEGAVVQRAAVREGEFVALALSEARGPAAAAAAGVAAGDGRGFVHGMREAELERIATHLAASSFAAREGRDLVLIVDDLHHADPDSLDFLAILRRHLAESGAALCLAGRPGAALENFRELLKTRGDPAAPLEEITLGPLAAAELGTLVVSLLGDPGDASSPRAVPLTRDDHSLLLEWMEEKTGGNPRLAEAALSELLRRGALKPSEQGWALEPGALPAEIPSLSAHQHAAGRLDALSEPGRSLLEIAAVLGREFEVETLAAMEESGGDALAGFLADAVRQGILAPGPNGPERLRFTHPDLARAAYELVPGERRKELHRRAAETLVARGAVHPARARELARHHDGAGNHARARDSFLLAAREDYRAGAYRDAARSFREAWVRSTAAGRAGSSDFALDWIHALFLSGHYEEGSAVVAEVRAGVGEGADPVFLRRLAVLEGICLAFAGRQDRAREVLGPVVNARGEPGDPSLEAWAHLEYGWLEVLDDRDDRAREQFTRARELARRSGDARVKGLAEMRLGILEFRRHHPREALQWHERARDTFISAAIEDHLPGVWANMALCRWNLLETRQAIRYHRRAVEGYARRHRRAEVARGHTNLAIALAEMGRWDEAEEAIAAADRWNRGTYAPAEESYLEYARSLVFLYRGDLEDAARHAARAVELAHRSRQRQAEYGHLALEARVHHRRGDTARAEQGAGEALARAREVGDRWVMAECLRVQGLVELARGDLVRAGALAAEGVALVSDPEIPAVRFRLDLLHAELLVARGDGAAARGILERWHEKLGDTDLALWEGELALAEGSACFAEKNLETAGSLLSRAYEIFARLGAEQLRAETLVALARVRADQGHLSASRAAWRGAESLRTHHHLPAWDEALQPAGSADATPGAETPAPEGAPPPRAAIPMVSERRVLEAASALSRELVAPQDLDQVLEKILDVVVTYLGTERGVIALADPVSGALRVALARNMDRESEADALQISRSALERAGAQGEMIFAGDALADPDLGTHESIQRLRIRSLLATPLRLQGEIVGVLYVDHRELTDLFGPEELLFLQFIADMAAVGIRNARRLARAEGKARELRGELEGVAHVFAETAARSPLMQEIMERASVAARAGRVVLITGDNGVGKDHLARLIHRMSGRKGKFVNCPLTTFAPSLIESELFGVARGAATGVHARRGLVEEAQDGTLHLNEIGDLPPDLQVKLLELLDHGEYRRVGSEEALRYRGLILCATNADLEAMVAERRFRQDLYYRISGDVIRVPALRDHPEDIPELVEIFLRRQARELGGEPPIVSPRARDLLCRCRWEGNVRELQLCVRRAAVRATDGLVEPQHLESPSMRTITRRDTEGVSSTADGELSPGRIRLLRDALDRAGGVVSRVAREFGVSDPTAWRWIRRAGLEHMAVRRWSDERRAPARPRRPRPRRSA